jgi:signal transduction histidine kinase
VTGTLDADRTDLPGGRSRSSFGYGLNFLGIAVVAFWLVANGIRAGYPWWAYALGAVALAGWAMREVSGRLGVRIAASVLMIVAGSAAVVVTESLIIVPVIVGVVLLQAAIELPVWLGPVAALVALVEISTTAAVTGTGVQFVVGTGAGLLLGVLIGISRRQFRLAEQQHRRSVEEAQRAALLAEKSRAARDIHDVLAHSLGGLVLQLDAVEALLEVGRTDEARSRASDARTLAADGLAEARRAVATLRDEPSAPEQPIGPVVSERPATPSSDLASLVAAHRDFGGTVRVTGDLALADVDDAAAAAVVAAGREALSNARKHAPGRPVDLSVVRDGSAVRVVVANPVGPGGHGIVGMRERFAELGAGSSVEAERAGDEFVVTMRVPVRIGPGEAR